MIILDSILITVKNNIEAVLAIFVAISALPQAFSAIKINSIGKRLSKTDTRQNEAISKLKETVVSINSSVLIFEKYIKKNEFNKLLKSKINTTVLNIVNTYKLDNAFASMCIEGGQKAYLLFADIYEIGLKNIQNEDIKILAITALRSIRSQYSGNRVVSKEQSENIKKNVAYPLIAKLIFDLTQFKQNNYNGQTENIYLKICVKFVESFILQSIRTL